MIIINLFSVRRIGHRGWFGTLCGSTWVTSAVRRQRRRRAGTEHSLAVGVIMWHLDDPSNPIRSQKLIVLIKEIFLCTAPEI